MKSQKIQKHKAPGLIAPQTLTKLKSVSSFEVHSCFNLKTNSLPKIRSQTKISLPFNAIQQSGKPNKTDRHRKSQIKQVQWKNSGHKFPLACSHSISAVSFIPNTNTFPFVTGRASIGLQKKLTSFIVSCRAGIGFQQSKPTPFGNGTKAKGKHAHSEH